MSGSPEQCETCSDCAESTRCLARRLETRSAGARGRLPVRRHHSAPRQRRQIFRLRLFGLRLFGLRMANRDQRHDPRDRSGSFEPLLIAKGQKRFEGFDEKIIAMYARG